jgi:4'-phosphopantetheinyl transferase
MGSPINPVQNSDSDSCLQSSASRSGHGDIHVWTVWLDRYSNDIPTLQDVLSFEERLRADKFHLARDRKRYIVVRAILRYLLAGYLRENPKKLEFGVGRFGKPHLCSQSEDGESLSFNISHSADVLVIAVAYQRNLGVDVELMREDYDYEKVAALHFSQREFDELCSLPEAERAEAFFRGWTSKEACVKACGRGLNLPLQSFSVSLLSSIGARVLDGAAGQWNLRSFEPAVGYRATLAYDGPPCPIPTILIRELSLSADEIGALSDPQLGDAICIFSSAQ